jgi:uncharacterized protein YndB with AHSA1/START domain
MAETQPELSTVLRRRVRASPADVFADWTVAERLDWYLNPENRSRATVPITVDLRVGGAWCVPMIVDSTTAYVTGGVYRQIQPSRALRFAWGARPGWPDPDDGFEGALVLGETGGQTHMEFTLSWAAPSGTDVAGWSQCVDGWGSTIDRLVDRYG